MPHVQKNNLTSKDNNPRAEVSDSTATAKLIEVGLNTVFTACKKAGKTVVAAGAEGLENFEKGAEKHLHDLKSFSRQLIKNTQQELAKAERYIDMKGMARTVADTPKNAELHLKARKEVMDALAPQPKK